MPSTTSKDPLSQLEEILQTENHGKSAKELKELANQAVDNSRTNKEVDLLTSTNLARSLELRGNIYRDLGEYSPAHTDYIEALGLISSSSAADEGMGRISSSIAVIHDNLGESEQAKSFYERAIAAFGRMNPPASLDIADLSNNLAFLYEAEGDFDRAETLLLNALKSCHEILGDGDPQTAALFNNVGTLYFKAGHDQRAKEMHTKALEGRQEAFGDNHHETAQSHGNLALVYVREKNLKAAFTHFEKALTGFEQNLDHSKEDYLIVAANYQDILQSRGEDAALAKLKERISQNSQ